MPTYIIVDGQIVDKATGKPDPVPKTFNPPRIHIVSDYKPYRCPVTEKVIEGRRAHQENLKRTGCRLQEPGEKEQFLRERAKDDAKLERTVSDAVDRTAAQLDV